MGDYIHLFNGLKKAIQMRDEDEENEDDDDEEIEDEEEELNVSSKITFSIYLRVFRSWKTMLMM